MVDLPRDSEGRVVESALGQARVRRIRAATEYLVREFHLATVIAELIELDARRRHGDNHAEAAYRAKRRDLAFEIALHIDPHLPESDHEVVEAFTAWDYRIPRLDYRCDDDTIAPAELDEEIKPQTPEERYLGVADAEKKRSATLYQLPLKWKPRRSRLIVGQQGAFNHTFGGESPYDGAVPAGGKHPIHLLFRLDLTDSKIKIDLGPIRYLPLLYPFQYGASIVYHVQSDSCIQIDWIRNCKWKSDYPYENYPPQFSPKPVVVTEPKVVGVDRGLIDDHNVECAEEDRIHFDSMELLVEVAEGFWQGAHTTPCQTPSCSSELMNVLSVINCDDVPNVSFWGQEADDNFGVRIIFCFCQRCGALYGTNEC